MFVVPESEITVSCALRSKGFELVIVEHVRLVLLEGRAEGTENDAFDVLDLELRRDVKPFNAQPVNCHELLIQPQLHRTVLVV